MQECLQRRLNLWRDGDFDSLVREIQSIQSKLKYQDIPTTTEALAKKFNNFMMIGNVKAALKLLSANNNARVLPLTPETLNLLDEKHSQAEAKQDDMMLEGPEIFIGEFEYNDIDGDLIQKSALHTKGAAGPSNLDADGWKRILTSNMYGKHNSDLCNAIAMMARTLCIKRYCCTDGFLDGLFACRLIPLDKSPDLRPIGIGEILRRIIGKSVMAVMKTNIIDSVGNLQLCAGQKSGCEAAVHSMSNIFKEESTDGILLVDASNAFNSFNRQVMLHNIRITCPLIATFIINSYNNHQDYL